ncbi:MAG: glycosyltransferase family 39 protein [Anaerolineales bacterium]|nr:glycosyltransferase family 39 protein [Anaerolineales bacterium]
MKLRLTNLSPNFVVFLLMCVFFIIAFLSVLGKSLTYDEARNFNYGKALVLNGDTNRPGDRSILDGAPIAGSMMPVSALNALPFKLGMALPDGILKKILLSIETARLISVLFSMLFALLVYRWSAELYGFVPAIFSLILYIFDPNIIAQSQLVTTDMYAWGTTLLVFYCSWKFANRRAWQNGLIWSAALAISSLAKYTTIILIPLSLLTIFLHDLPELSQRIKGNALATLKSVFGKYLLYLLGALVASSLLINLGFLFNKTFLPFGEYKFESHLMSGIQTRLPFLKNLPTPVPYPYLQGFDLTYYYGEEGKAFGDTYLLGQLKDGKEPFYGYYIIVAFLKVPIATQVLFWAAVYLYASKPANRKNFFTNDLFLLAPILFFFFYFNFMFSINTGIRYYLVLFPLLYIFCGSAFKNWSEFSKLQKRVSVGLAGYLCISMLSYFPTYMPYFNEFLWDKKQAYKILADSNLDYGQSENVLKDFLAAHPTAHYNPPAPTSGLIVMSVNDLVGVFGRPQDFTWLRENFEPDETIDHTYLVYRITPAELEAFCSTLGNCP